MVKCQFKNCKTQPTFGLEGEKPTRCSKHKLENMIDVFHKRCQFKNCKTQPTFGLEGEKPTRCSKHKLENMIDVINKRCQFKDCITIPSFGIKGQKARMCYNHKLENMIDVINKQCRGQDGLCTIRANPKYDNYCTFCFQYYFPTDPRTKLIHNKSKEIKVGNYLDDFYED